MNDEFWIDGFNFFYQWEKSRELFLSGGEMGIARSLERAVRILSRELGGRRRAALVFLDGGLDRREARQAGMRVRYCGPGNKADDRMAEDLAGLGADAKRVTAVSNDRELRARLRLHGASCLGVAEFLALLEKRNGGGPARGGRKKTGKGGNGGQGGDSAEVMREKCRSLSPSEVKAWLELFGKEGEDDDVSL